jgi:hypothetical protein
VKVVMESKAKRIIEFQTENKNNRRTNYQLVPWSDFQMAATREES